MAMHSNMTPEQRERAIDKVSLQILALEIARQKLRKRRDTVAGLSGAELLLIKLEMTRLDFKIDLLIDSISAFELSTAPLAAPSENALKEMKKKVEAIRQINVNNKAARAIVKAAVAAAGQKLPSSTLT